MSLIPKRVQDTVDVTAYKIDRAARDTKTSILVTAVIACAALIVAAAALVVAVGKD